MKHRVLALRESGVATANEVALPDLVRISRLEVNGERCVPFVQLTPALQHIIARSFPVCAAHEGPQSKDFDLVDGCGCAFCVVAAVGGLDIYEGTDGVFFQVSGALRLLRFMPAGSGVYGDWEPIDPEYTEDLAELERDRVPVSQDGAVIN